MPKVSPAGNPALANPRRSLSEKLFAGVDVGKDGGIVIVNSLGKIVYETVMPTIGAKRPAYDIDAIAEIFRKYAVSHVGIENPSGMQGLAKTAVASLNYCVGIFEGVMVSLKVPHSLINPKVWQNKVWEGNQKVTFVKDGKNKVDTKATSLVIAKKLLPGHDFRKTSRATKPHDGIVDAFLIATYVKNK